MQFRLLGTVEVRIDGKPVELGRRRERCLLALLLLEAGHVVPMTRLTDLLWDGSPGPEARSAVRVAVARLRRRLSDASAVSPVRLLTSGDGYVIDVSPDRVDALTFQRLVTEARSRSDVEGKAAQLSEALQLWRGPALADVASGWLRERICTPWEEQRLAAIEDLNEVRLALGGHTSIVGPLAHLVAEHPLRERLRGQLMLALYRSSRRAEALAVYREGWRLLARDHGLEPGPELRRLERAIHASDSGLDVQPDALRLTIGATTGETSDESVDAPPACQAWRRRFRAIQLFGRDDDLRLLPRRVMANPVVTLVGPPGSGKTRLACELITVDFAKRFSDGVAVVELDTILDPVLVVPAIATALGTHHDYVTEDVAWLATTLRKRQLLLIMDNCEHMLDECVRVVSALIGKCPGVRVLATSREPLGLEGELVHDVGPLDLPPDDSPDTVVGSAAGGMFLACATNAVDLSPENAPHIAALCRLVDGLPLAIELAAARLRTISLEQMIAHLHRQLDLLARGSSTANRHRSLRAAMDWSYELLTEAERLLLSRASVFSGSFTLEAAEACLADDTLPAPIILDTLCALVDRSLVTVEDVRATRRFRLLEVVRQYGAERLIGVGQHNTIHLRHAEYFCEFVENTYQRRRCAWPAQLRAVDADYTNVRSATDWSIRNTPELAARLVGALQWYWMRRHPSDGRLLAQQATAVMGGLPTELQRRVLLTLGSIEQFADPPSYARLAEGLALAKSSGDHAGEIPFLVNLSFARWACNDIEAALTYAQRADELARAYGDDYARARTLCALGYMLGYAGDWPAARKHLTEARDLFAQTRDDWGSNEVDAIWGELAYLHGDSETAYTTLQNVIGNTSLLADSLDWTRSRTILGWIYLDRGQPDVAQQLLSAAFDPHINETTRWFGAGWLLGLGLTLGAGISQLRADNTRAAVLLGAVERAERSPTAGPPDLAKRRHDQLASAVAANLSEQEFHEAVHHGAAMCLEAALSYMSSGSRTARGISGR